MASKSSYAFKRLSFQFDNFTPIDEDDCGLYFLSSNTVMMCLAFLQHYGKWESRYAYDLNAQNPQRLSEDDFDLITEIVDQGIKELMTDACHSLQEIEFTLKHMLTIFSSNKKIFWSIQKPPEPDENNGNPYLSHGIFDSNLEYNIIKDAGNPDNPSTNQLWGLGELFAKAFLNYPDVNNQPVSPVVVESLLKGLDGKSAQEIEFVLKHLLTKFTDETEIKYFVDKPAEPTRLPDGTFDPNSNPSLESPGLSVFTVGSLLENNSVTDVLKIALLDDGTIQFPDINPFNLESKIDTLNETAIEAKDIHSWFASAFYSGKWSDFNPWAIETFFQRFSATFNKTIPFTQIVTESFYSLHNRLNDNFVTTFNETNTDGVASNSYFRYLHTWLSSDWKLFQTAIEAIRDCICLGKDYLNGAVLKLNDINTTLTSGLINFVGGAHLLTIAENLGFIKGAIEDKDVCCDDATEATRELTDAIKDLIDEAKDNGSTVTDNGDGTYTVEPIDPPSEPINPNEPFDPETNPIDKPYVPVILKQPDNTLTVAQKQDAVCGFTFYTLNKAADFIDDILAELGSLRWVVDTVGLSGSVERWVKIMEGTGGGVFFRFIPFSTLRMIVGKFFSVPLTITNEVIYLFPHAIREMANDAACGSGQTVVDRQAIQQELYDMGQSITGNNLAIDFVMYVINTFYDYGLYSPLENATGINIADYAQYCPCPHEPLPGDWNGTWYKDLANRAKGQLQLVQDGTSLTGTWFNVDVIGVKYSGTLSGTLTTSNGATFENDYCNGCVFVCTSHPDRPNTTKNLHYLDVAHLDSDPDYYR